MVFLVVQKKKSHLTAYADDVEFLVTHTDDFEKIQSWIQIYEKASNAKTNFEKSKGLWTGSWRQRTDEPLNIKWNNMGLKMLGVYLGNTSAFTNRNWTELVTKIQNSFEYWSYHAPNMSYKARVLIVNHLIASKLLYRFNCLSPPTETVSFIQTSILNFFWQTHRSIDNEITKSISNGWKEYCKLLFQKCLSERASSQ